MSSKHLQEATPGCSPSCLAACAQPPTESQCHNSPTCLAVWVRGWPWVHLSPLTTILAASSRAGRCPPAFNHLRAFSVTKPQPSAWVALRSSNQATTRQVFHSTVLCARCRRAVSVGEGGKDPSADWQEVTSSQATWRIALYCCSRMHLDSWVNFGGDRCRSSHFLGKIPPFFFLDSRKIHWWIWASQLGRSTEGMHLANSRMRASKTS